MFTLAISCLTTYLDFRFLHSIGLYSIRLYFHHQAHQQLGIVLLRLCLFILSGVISPLFSSSLLGTYHPREFIFQCHIFLPFHTVHGVLKARILKQFAIPFSSGLCFVRTFTMTHPSWVALHGMAHPFIKLDKAVVLVISLISFL